MNAPTARDWAGLAALVALWSSAFALTSLAVSSAPPEIAAAGRIWIAAALIAAWAWLSGARPPPVRPRPDPIWPWLAALGLFGVVAPFMLVSIAQTKISSALTGVLMALVPLTTAFLAHVAVPGERLNRRRLLGVLIGLAGAIYLIGPGALADLGGPAVWGQLAALGAAFCYALSSIIARRAPPAAPAVTTAGLLIAGAVMITPIGAAGALRMETPPSAASLTAIIALGVGATGVGSLIWLHIIRSAGPTFLSMVNYLVPIAALLIGAALGEELPGRIYLALPVILVGVLLVARRSG